MTEVRSYVLSNPEGAGALITATGLSPLLRKTYAKDLPAFVDIKRVVSYCGRCKTHFTAATFEKLPLCGVQRGAEGEPLCVLRNCHCQDFFGLGFARGYSRGAMTIGADIEDVGEPLPDTERKP